MNSAISGSVKEKKLLILGGNALLCDIVTTARTMGVHTIVIDWFDDFHKSPAKIIADEHRLISVADVDAVVEFISSEGIDGVLTGFADSILQYYQRICEKAGLPCFCTKEQIEIMTNKSRFKKLCNEYSVPVPIDYELQYPVLSCPLDKIQYPIIIKPVDNSGGKGIIVARDESTLLHGLEFAKNYSQKKGVVVEQYIEGGTHFTASYSMANGRYVLSAMYDRIMNSKEESCAAMCIGSRHPSKYIQHFIRQVDPQLQKLMKSVGLANGTMTFQGVIKNEQISIYDPIMRLPGDQFYRFTEIQNGTNCLSRLIRYAITGQMIAGSDSLSRDDPHFSKPCLNLCINISPGKICSINGLAALNSLPCVFHVVQNYFVGDSVTIENRQAFLKVKISAANNMSLANTVRKIYDIVQVISDRDDDMLIDKMRFDKNQYVCDMVETLLGEV